MLLKYIQYKFYSSYYLRNFIMIIFLGIWITHMKGSTSKLNYNFKKSATNLRTLNCYHYLRVDCFIEMWYFAAMQLHNTVAAVSSIMHSDAASINTFRFLICVAFQSYLFLYWEISLLCKQRQFSWKIRHYIFIS